MRRVPPRAATLLLACAVTASLTACGSSGPGSPASSSPTETAAQLRTKHLQSLVLQPSEAPKGWTGTAHRNGGSATDSTTSQALASCLHVKTVDAGELQQVHSDDYSDGKHKVASDAALLSTQGDVRSDTKLTTSKKASSCFATLLRKQVVSELPGATITTFKAGITGGRHGGPSNVVGLISATVGARKGSQSVTIHFASWLITGPRLEASVEFTSNGKALSSAAQLKLVRLVAARVARG